MTGLRQSLGPLQPLGAPAPGKSFVPPTTRMPSLASLDGFGESQGNLSGRVSLGSPTGMSASQAMGSSQRHMTDLDTDLVVQSAARKERDVKLATLEGDIDEVNVSMKTVAKKTAELSATVSSLTVRARPGRSNALTGFHRNSTFIWRFCMATRGA